jgi:ubiquinone/menaquinone biosynthesis C-methylase UbiE
MIVTTTLWKNYYTKLGQIDPTQPLKNEVVKRTMAPSEYKECAEMIIKELDPQDSVLEIGCGFGGLAQEILKNISVSYTVVDNELMLNQAKMFLNDKVEYIIADKIETIQSREFELFISHFCLSETPFEYREYILKNIIRNCRKIHIKDYDDCVKPTPEMVERGYDIAVLNIEKYIREYFIIEKTKGIYDRFLFTGKRK